MAVRALISIFSYAFGTLGIYLIQQQHVRLVFIHLESHYPNTERTRIYRQQTGADQWCKD